MVFIHMLVFTANIWGLINSEFFFSFKTARLGDTVLKRGCDHFETLRRVIERDVT